MLYPGADEAELEKLTNAFDDRKIPYTVMRNKVSAFGGFSVPVASLNGGASGYCGVESILSRLDYFKERTSEDSSSQQSL